MNKRTAEAEFRQHRGCIRQRIHRQRAVDFFNILTGPLLLELTDAHLPEHPERLYPPAVNLSMFIEQVLKADGSCQRSVNGRAAQRTAQRFSADPELLSERGVVGAVKKTIRGKSFGNGLADF